MVQLPSSSPQSKGQLKRPTLPPRSIGKGTVFHYGGMFGVVIGDHTSPGGMQGYYQVVLCTSFGGKVNVSYVQLPADKIVPVEVRPTDFTVLD